MSSFNVSDLDIKQVEKPFVIPSVLNGNDPFQLKTNNNSYNLSGSTKHVGYSFDCERPKNALNFDENEVIIRRLNSNRRYRRSLDYGIRDNGMANSRNPNPYGKPNLIRGSTAFNGTEMKSSYSNYRKMKSYQETYNDQYWDMFSPHNAKKILIDPFSTNGSLHETTYNNNGTQGSKTKTTNSFGSSYPIQSMSLPAIIPSNSSKNMYSTTINHNQSQDNGSALLQNGGHIQANDQICPDNRTIINNKYYINADPVQFVELNNLCYRNNNMITKLLDRKDSIPECQEPDIRSQLVDSSSDHTADMYPINNGSYISRDESQTTVATEHRNSIAYINPPMPLFIYSNGTVSDSRNISIHPQLCFAYSNDAVIVNNSTSTDHSNKNLTNVAYMLPQQDPTNGIQYFYAPTVVDRQIPSSNVEFSTVNDHSTIPIDADLSAAVCRSPSTVESTIMGKFTVTTTRKEDHCKGEEEMGKGMPSNLTKKSDGASSQQPRSRFKKTRIRETVERWQTNGLSTYDCRFKVIPKNIIELQGRNPEYMNEDYQRNICQDIESHDCGYRCHSEKYYNKEFFFWDDGERILHRGNSDSDSDTYCHFHAKYLELLNQNQNLSLSKFVPQYFNVPTSETPSSPQTIRAIFLTSSEIGHPMVNTDDNCTQIDPFLAPPASPSLVSSLSNANPEYNHLYGRPLVMVRCQTPVTLSNTSMNESLPVRIKSSSRMSSESDSASTTGRQLIDTDSNSLMDVMRSLDNVAISMSSRPSANDTDGIGTGNNSQPSVYSVDQIPHFHCPGASPLNPALPISLSDKHNRDNPAKFSTTNHSTLSSNVIHQIDDSLSSLKNMIHSLVLSEQQPLMDEITSLVADNLNLKSQLSRVKHRCAYLERILREHNVVSDIFVGHENSSMPNLSLISNDDIGHS